MTQTPNNKLISAIFAKLEDERYYGTFEVTLVAGKLKFVRKIQSLQDFELAAQCWDLLSIEAQQEIRTEFGSNAKFQELMRGRK